MWNETLTVLERRVPDYFKGARRVFHESIKGGEIIIRYYRFQPHDVDRITEMKETLGFRSDAPRSGTLSQRAKLIIETNFEAEIELYKYLRKRLNDQLNSK